MVDAFPSLKGKPFLLSGLEVLLAGQWGCLVFSVASDSGGRVVDERERRD